MLSFWFTLAKYFSSQGNPSLTATPPVSMNKNLEEAEGLIFELLEIYDKLKSTKSLKPSDEVDSLFERLVNLCILNRNSQITNQVLQDPRLLEIRADFRRLCDVAECCLESHWADIIIGQEDSSPDDVYERLKLFPYYQNYVDLTKLEFSAIYGVRNSIFPISKIAFLGSGPLPLTSLCLCGVAGNPLHLPGSSHASQNTVSVLNIDNNAMAIEKSRILIERLGTRGNGMDFLAFNAGNLGDEVDLRDFDVVYLAALVGESQVEKEAVLVKVLGRMREGALLVVRSANRLRTILYPKFDPSSEVVARWLDICAVVHPYNHVVNSVVVGRVKGRKLSATS